MLGLHKEQRSALVTIKEEVMSENSGGDNLYRVIQAMPMTVNFNLG